MLRRPLTTVTLEASELDAVLVECDINKAAHDDYENPFFMELMVWVDQLHKLQMAPDWLPSKTEIANMNESRTHDLWLQVGTIVEDFTEEQEARLLIDTASTTPNNTSATSSRPSTAGTIRRSSVHSTTPQRRTPVRGENAPRGARRMEVQQIEVDMLEGPASPEDEEVPMQEDEHEDSPQPGDEQV